MIPVSSQSGLLEFPVGLIQQILRLLGVSIHIPFVGFLRSDYLLISPFRYALGRGEIRMSMRVDVLNRPLSQTNRAAKQRRSQN